MQTRKSPISCENVPVKGKKGSFCFRREEHLKGRNEIRDVFGKGKRFFCNGAKLFVLKNGLPYNRICFTFSKSKGTSSEGKRGLRGAVARNRAKRLGREAFRLLKPRISGGNDLILLVYPESKMTLSVRIEQIETLFLKAGLFSRTLSETKSGNTD